MLKASKTEEKQIHYYILVNCDRLITKYENIYQKLKSLVFHARQEIIYYLNLLSI